MGDRRLVTNQSGVRVAVDVGRDMDEATFDAMVKRGELTPVSEPKSKAQSKSSTKK